MISLQKSNNKIKLIAAFRMIRAILVLIFVATVWSRPDLTDTLIQLGQSSSDSTVFIATEILTNFLRVPYLNKATMLIVLIAWAVLLIVQSYGLWYGCRWAKHLSLATSAAVLFAIIVVSNQVLQTQLWLVITINLIIMIYLVVLLIREN